MTGTDNVKTEGAARAAERLERLVLDHHAAVVSYVRRRVRSDLVDDVVAETFLVAWRRLDDVPADSLPWLFGVARNVVGTQRRAAGRRESLRERLGAPERDRGHEASNLDEARSPVLDALSSLSERDRETLTLVAWDGLTPREAASALGLSPATFHVRLHRAKRRFRRELDRATPHRPQPALGKEAFHE